jgi:hypothetical protein
MPVSFLTEDQRNNYGRYIGAPTDKELACFFHMSDNDQILLMRRRGNHNKLGFALQLGTVRFLGTFLEDPMDIPDLVIQAMAAKLNISELGNIHEYRTGEQRWDHANEICEYYGYRDITDPIIGFRLSRWLCELCWTGTERPGVLFDRAKNWLLVNKILLPGISTLERLIARVRSLCVANSKFDVLMMLIWEFGIRHTHTSLKVTKPLSFAITSTIHFFKPAI